MGSASGRGESTVSSVDRTELRLVRARRGGAASPAADSAEVRRDRLAGRGGIEVAGQGEDRVPGLVIALQWAWMLIDRDRPEMLGRPRRAGRAGVGRTSSRALFMAASAGNPSNMLRDLLEQARRARDRGRRASPAGRPSAPRRRVSSSSSSVLGERGGEDGVAVARLAVGTVGYRRANSSAVRAFSAPAAAVT